MIDKYAEIQDRILLYNACKGILRLKTANYTEKRAFPVVQVVGGVAGAGIGGYGGYRAGDALAKRWKLDPNSWKARALRWGGATVGGIGGAAVGAFAPTMLMRAGTGTAAAGTLANTAKTVGNVASAGSTVMDLANAVTNKPAQTPTVAN